MLFFFFFNDTATTEIYTLSLHDALPICRGQGEVASILQMVDYATAHYGSDTHRVYVTGLSAGGAMTAALLAAYPDRFAGGAVMSGIPAGCATTLTEAYPCMSSNQNRTPAQWGDLVRQADPGWSGAWPRGAVWHGTARHTRSGERR